MFDKTIKVEINRVFKTLTNEQVKELMLKQQDYQTLEAKYDTLQVDKIVQHDALARRLELANSKLKEYGHISEF